MADINHSYVGHLVLRAQEGDSDAFAELYAVTYQHTYNYAVHYLRNRDLAQDAVQETYILALKNIKNIKEPSLFVAWINQICFRSCYDLSRRNASGNFDIDSELLELVRDEHPEHNPEENTADNDEKSRLNRAVNNLPFNEQQVIVMRYYNDMKLEDIADALRISRSSVKRYLNAAKERLAEIIRREDV